MHRPTAESPQNPEFHAVAGVSTQATAVNETQLRSLAILQQVIDSLPQAICWKDRNDVFLGCNRVFAEAVGLNNPAEIVGKAGSQVQWASSLLDFSPEHDRTVIEHKQPQHHLIQSALQTDQQQWLDVSRIPLYDGLNSIIGVISVIEDVTDHYQSEQQLRTSQQFLNNVIDGISDPIFVKDSQQQWRLLNQSMCDLIGYSREELIGKSDYDVFPAAEADIFWELDQLVFLTGVGHINEETLTDASGETHFISTKKSLFQDAWGNQFLVGTIRDITERKRAEKALQESEARLQKLSANLEQRVHDRTAELAETNRILELTIAQHNQTEAALRESEALLRALVENLPFDFWAYDIDGRYIMQNASDINHWGYLVGKRPQDLNLPPDVVQLWQEQTDYVLTGEVLRTENHYQVDGKTRICSTILAPIWSGTEIRGTLGVNIDVTEQKQAEEALRQNEERLRLVLQSIPVMMDAFDEDGNIIMWNSECERVTGYHAAEIIRNSQAMELLYPDAEYRAQMLQEWARLGNNFRNWEWEIGCKDGSTKTILWSNLSEQFPIPGWAGWGIGLDISDRKLAEMALRQSEQQLRDQAQRERLLNHLISQIRNSLDFDTILETVLQEIQSFVRADRCQFAWYHADEDPPYWNVIRESRSYELPDLTGYYPASVVGPLANKLLNLEILQIPDVDVVEDQIWQQFVQSLGWRAVLATPMQMQSGMIGVICCSHSSQVRFWADNEVEALQAVMGQLSIALTQAELYTQSRYKTEELEEALHELQRTQAQMIQSEKMSSLGQLVAGVAHEINNPVNFIYGNLSHASSYAQDLLHLIRLYQKHYPNPAPEIQAEAAAIDLNFLLEDLPKLLGSMRVGADRIQQIVLSLRNFSRMDEAEFKAVDIHEGIDSTLMILQSRIKANSRRAAIEVIKEYSPLPLVECYPGQLNQVFMNIFSNAIDALEESEPVAPRLQICTERSKDAVVIKIADNGCGMNEGQRQRLFDPFFTTKPVGKGTGLGLSISYQIIVEKHGGQLTCNSTPGHGTEFCIEIPIHRSADPLTRF